MKPFSNQIVLEDHNKRIFNYRFAHNSTILLVCFLSLCRARRVVENAFGLLAARFRIFLKAIETSDYVSDEIVKVLKNYLNIEKNVLRLAVFCIIFCCAMSQMPKIWSILITLKMEHGAKLVKCAWFLATKCDLLRGIGQQIAQLKSVRI